MKKLLTTLSVALLFSSSVSTLNAAQDSSEIQLETTVAEYVNIVGSVAGASKFYTFDDLAPVGGTNRSDWITLGTLGFESNNVGDCDVEFSTKHNFRLRHVVSNQRLTNYRLRYEGKVINRNNNRQNVLPCSLTASNLELQKVGALWRENTQAGVYQDVVTVTIATQ